MEIKNNQVFLNIENDTIKTDIQKITIHGKNNDELLKFIKILQKIFNKYNIENSDDLINIKYFYTAKPKNLFKDCEWYEMPDFKPNESHTECPIIYFSYNIKKINPNILPDLSKLINIKLTLKTKTIWYPEKSEKLKPSGDLYISTEEKYNKPKYPIYIISKGRWESRLTAKYLEKIKVDYKIVVEPNEYDEYSKVIKPEKILILPDEYLNKNQGSVPARNFVWKHSKDAGHERHWILDDNIRSYKRYNESEKKIVDGGCVFKIVEDYVDRYTNIKLAGHNYSMFCIWTNTSMKPITKNTRIYSSILLSNDIFPDFAWRGKYNEDVDLSIRILKAGYPTIEFNAINADKLKSQTLKGGNTDSIYNVKDALYIKAKSLQEQHPDIVKICQRYGHFHHQVDYSSFKNLKPILKNDVKLKDEINNYGMKFIKM